MMKIMTATLLALGLSACANVSGEWPERQDEDRNTQSTEGLETLSPNESTSEQPEGIDTATDPSQAPFKLLPSHCE